MSDQLIVFYEGANVKQKFDSLSGSQLVLLVMFVDPGLTTTEECLLLDVVPSLDEGLGLSGESDLVLDKWSGHGASRPSKVSS